MMPQEKRKALLDRFYTNFDWQGQRVALYWHRFGHGMASNLVTLAFMAHCICRTYEELLADNFEIVEAKENSKPHSKKGARASQLHARTSRPWLQHDMAGLVTTSLGLRGGLHSNN